jgi:hypothetical protein
MFEQFSERSCRVIFLTRLAAGRRGAAALDYEHLLEGVLREDDQRRLPPPFNDAQMAPLRKPHRAFFADDIASELLSELNSVSASGAAPIPDTVDMELTKALANTLSEAVAFAADSQHKAVEPLHILAAVLTTDSPVSGQLQRHGVSRDVVLAAIESGEFF